MEYHRVHRCNCLKLFPTMVSLFQHRFPFFCEIKECFCELFSCFSFLFAKKCEYCVICIGFKVKISPKFGYILKQITESRLYEGPIKWKIQCLFERKWSKNKKSFSFQRFQNISYFKRQIFWFCCELIELSDERFQFQIWIGTGLNFGLWKATPTLIFGLL